MNRQIAYPQTMGRWLRPVRVIAAVGALALVAACGAPASPVTIRNAANATVVPGDTPTAPVLAATAVPATRAATVQATAAATSDNMAGMETGGTAAVTQSAATTAATSAPGSAASATETPFVLSDTLFGTQTPSAASGAATTNAASTSVSGSAASATETPFVLINVLFGTQAPTAASGAAPTNAESTGVAPTAASATATAATVATTAPTVAAATSAGTQAASASGGQGDPKHGQQIFTGAGTCSTCHDVAQGIQIVGPSLKGVATRAGTRVPGLSASEYLRQSILTPNAFVVPNFVGGIMPQNLSKTLSAKDIDDVIAYLLTLK